MDIMELRSNKKRLHGVKFKFDTNNLKIRNVSNEDMVKYISACVNEMFIDKGLYFNKVLFKPDNGDVFIQVLRNDFSLNDFSEEFKEIYSNHGHEIFYGFTIGMQSVYLDRWQDITDTVLDLSKNSRKDLRIYNIFDVFKSNYDKFRAVNNINKHALV